VLLLMCVEMCEWREEECISRNKKRTEAKQSKALYILIKSNSTMSLMISNLSLPSHCTFRHSALSAAAPPSTALALRTGEEVTANCVEYSEQPHPHSLIQTFLESESLSSLNDGRATARAS
jgi:hypothetical protein